MDLFSIFLMIMGVMSRTAHPPEQNNTESHLYAISAVKHLVAYFAISRRHHQLAIAR